MKFCINLPIPPVHFAGIYTKNKEKILMKIFNCIKASPGSLNPSITQYSPLLSETSTHSNRPRGPSSLALY